MTWWENWTPERVREWIKTGRELVMLVAFTVATLVGSAGTVRHFEAMISPF